MDGQDDGSAPRALHREASRALVSALVTGPLLGAHSLLVSLAIAPALSRYGAYATKRDAGYVALMLLIGGGVFAALLVLAEALARRARPRWRVPLLALLGAAVAALAAAAVTWVRALADGGPEEAWKALWDGMGWCARHPARVGIVVALAVVPFVLIGASRCDLPWRASTAHRDRARQLLAGLASGVLVFTILALSRDDIRLLAFVGYVGATTLTAVGLVLADLLEPRLAGWLRHRALGDAPGGP